MTTMPENNENSDEDIVRVENRDRAGILADIEKAEAEINRPDPIRLLDDLRVELETYNNNNPDTI